LKSRRRKAIGFAEDIIDIGIGIDSAVIVRSEKAIDRSAESYMFGNIDTSSDAQRSHAAFFSHRSGLLQSAAAEWCGKFWIRRIGDRIQIELPGKIIILQIPDIIGISLA